MEIKTLVFNPFGENTYVLYDETKECVIVDAGCFNREEQKTLVKFIEDNELTPVKILNTHCHIDHVFGNKFLVEKYNLDVYAHESETGFIDIAIQMAERFGLTVEQPPQVTKFLKQGDVVEFGNTKLNVIHVPGHSSGSLVYYCEEKSCIFSGDVLFPGSIGRTDLPGGDYDTLISNIKEKLLVLGDAVTVYPGHSMPTTIGYEKANNSFIK